MTDLIRANRFIDGPRLIDGTDLNSMIAEINAAQTMSARYTQVFDDFLGDTIYAAWDTKTGSDGAAAFTIGGLQGTLIGTTGADAGGTMALNGVQFDLGALNWQANQGAAIQAALVTEARLKLSAITNQSFFFGFTDQVASLEAPWTLSVVTYTSTATDSCGFLFDTAATVDTIRLVGVANDVDAANIDTGNAWAADTYTTFRVELGYDGTANFLINGAQVGKLTSAARATVPLVPVITSFSRTALSKIVTTDYLLARQYRL